MGKDDDREERAKAVGIWIRVSTEEQAQGDSPEHHEKRARFYAEAKEWHVREVYRLEAVSGKSVMEHPEAKRMLEHIRSGHITGLIFSKLARLARNTKELLEFSDIFRACEADLISLQENIDTSSPAGRLLYTMIAALSEWEREEISSRVAASVPIRAKLGKPIAGQTSYGYHWDNGKLVPHPTEAPVRRLIYELFLEHGRKKRVARILNERGYRTRKGDKWTDTTVGRLLRDPTAKGEHRANYTKSTGARKGWKLKPQSDWVIRQVPPIVSEDLWEQCNAILDDKRDRRRRRGRPAVHLFTGVTYCACGGKMYVFANSPKYVCKACKNKIGVTDLAEIFHGQLKGFFFSREQIAEHIKQADQVLREKEEQLVSLEAERKKVTQELDRIYNLYMADGITIDDYRPRNRSLSERLKELDDSIPRLQAQIDIMKISHLSRDEIIAEAQDLYTRWPALLEDEKRRIVETITERIVIGREDIEINLLYCPAFLRSPQKTTNSQGFIAATSWKRAG